jgi:2-dehydro-3-deoxygluconokinase
MTATGPVVGQRIVCFGELLLRLSAPGRELLLQSPRLDARFGGAEANVAVSLAILGHASAMVSTLPDNALGHACAGELRRHGVDTAGIRYGDGRMGLYFLAPGAMQRPSEVLYDRAGSAFACAQPQDYDWPRLLAGATWLHLSGIDLALGETAARATRAAVDVARSAGATVSFDANHRASLWADRAAQAPALLRGIVDETELLFGNDRDVARMLGEDFPHASAQARFRAAAAMAFAAWPRLKRIATLAREPSSVDEQQLTGLLATRYTVLETHAHPLANIVERIGGGDAFAAGLLHGLLRGMDDAVALDFATAAACLKHSVPGDANLLGESAMQAFLDQAGFEVKR